MMKNSVSLILYDFDLLDPIPSKCTHSEIIVFNKTFGFDDKLGITVKEETNLARVDSYKVKYVIELGFTTKSEGEFREIMRNLDREWTTADYNLFSRNCRHFSKRLILELNPTDKEEGLRVLANLIALSEKIGYICGVIGRSLLMTFLITPYDYIEYAFKFADYVSAGKFLDFDEEGKDILIIIMFIIIITYITLRLIKRFKQDSNTEVTKLTEAIDNMKL